ncbi:MAG: hypothetical protein WCK59_02720 [Candidatus Falkowbacteria bacterium]
MKKLITLFLFAVALFGLQISIASAASTTLSLSSTGEGDNVQISVSGDPSSGVLLLFQKTSGTSFIKYLGSSNASGYYSATFSTADLDVAPGSSVQVKINNQLSASVNWPYNSVTNSGAITLSKTGLILSVGGNNTININNLGSNKVYLLNNTNPQVANINLSGSQATVYANAYGQTVATICVLGTTSNCASAYITVQNSGAQPLTLSQSNLTIAYGQSSQVSILNSTGNYTILNNSNPNVITASLNAQTITLNASNNGGSAAITICTTDMSACGIINATVGSLSSSALTFNQTAPTLAVGQTLIVTISGSDGPYNISSNSNSSIVNAFISGNTLNLVGNGVGSSVVTVCSSQGNCNSLTATVSYASNGGALSLSQTNLWLQVGQAASVVVSGGTAPYSFLNDASSATYFQTSLNNNILTLTGISAGSANINVCSAGGACKQLSVLVNGVSSNTQLTFGNNNLNLRVGATSDVTLYGSGGYYISNSVNQNVATIVVNGNKATVTAVGAGSANATVCQTGGQCGVIYVSVTATNSLIPIAFNASNPTLSVGQNFSVSISGGSSNVYYISSNSNPAIVQANISGSILSLTGNVSGSSVINICSATNNCNSLSVTVNNVVTPVIVAPTPTTTPTSTPTPVVNTDEALLIFNGNVETIASKVGAKRNTATEKNYLTRYTKPLLVGLKLSTAAINNLNYFIVYGTPSTVKLGAGERAGVLGSYLSAYKKLPTALTDWSDLIRISTGNQPVGLSVAAENQAKLEFKKVYNRAPAMATSNTDLSAVKIIAYGLRFPIRNASAEKAAVKAFTKVYAHAPISPLAWNIVRAITYSGVIK